MDLLPAASGSVDLKSLFSEGDATTRAHSKSPVRLQLCLLPGQFESMWSEAGPGLGFIIALSSINSPYLLNSSSGGLVLPKLRG